MILSQLKVLAEIYLTYQLILGQLLGCTGFENLTLVEEIGAVGDGQRLVNVVVGDDYTDILILQRRNDTLNILYGDRVNAGEWLVEKYERRVDCDSSRNLGTTTLTSRKLVTVALAHLLQAELLDEGFNSVALVLLREVCHLEYGTYIILDTQVAEYRGLLCKVAHAHLCSLVNGHLGKLVDPSVVVLEEDASVVRFDKTYDHIERCGFARSVRSEQTDDFALLYIDRYVVYNGA